MRCPAFTPAGARSCNRFRVGRQAEGEERRKGAKKGRKGVRVV